MKNDGSHFSISPPLPPLPAGAAGLWAHSRVTGLILSRERVACWDQVGVFNNRVSGIRILLRRRRFRRRLSVLVKTLHLQDVILALLLLLEGECVREIDRDESLRQFDPASLVLAHGLHFLTGDLPFVTARCHDILGRKEGETY